jgi:prevent-host-death family protein
MAENQKAKAERRAPLGARLVTGWSAAGDSTIKGAMYEEGSMIDITKDIHSVTTFRRNPGQFMKQLKTNKRPLVLTVKGKAAAVVQDAESYQRLLDIVARADVHEAIRQGLDDVTRCRTRPAPDVFNEIRRQHGIPR